jgi:hypothetical protein
MPASSKFPVISRNVVFAGDGVFSPETRARAFADMAKGSILEIDRENDAALGRDVHYRTYVDGRETVDLRSAKDTSEIVARWDLTPGVVSYIDGLLAKSGPVLTGAYHNSRVIYADGVEIDDPMKAAGAREVMFMSLAPYARKIERGKKGYAPGHVYEAVAAMAKARFSNVALIKFTYAQPEGSAPGLRSWASKSAADAGSGRKQKHQATKNMRQPAILIYL